MADPNTGFPVRLTTTSTYGLPRVCAACCHFSQRPASDSGVSPLHRERGILMQAGFVRGGYCARSPSASHIGLASLAYSLARLGYFPLAYLTPRVFVRGRGAVRADAAVKASRNSDEYRPVAYCCWLAWRGSSHSLAPS